jgi:hypothetical protein
MKEYALGIFVLLVVSVAGLLTNNTKLRKERNFFRDLVEYQKAIIDELLNNHE